MVQVTLVQIDNYGPWTVTPEPRPEYDIQALQARLYADLASQFGARDGVAFFARFDNVLAVTDGVTPDEHRAIQQTLANRYPVTVSMGIGSAASPRDAVADATTAIQAEGSAQDADRVGRLAVGSTGDDAVEIAHFDADDATGRYTDRLDAFESLERMQGVYAGLLREMRLHGALTFFVGGDNFISVTPGLDDDTYGDVLDAVGDDADVALKVGVGNAAPPSAASMAAKEALERCRHDGEAVVREGVGAAS